MNRKYIVLTKDLMKWEHFSELAWATRHHFGELIRTTKRFEVLRSVFAENGEEIYVLDYGFKMPKRFTREWAKNKLVKKK